MMIVRKGGGLDHNDLSNAQYLLYPYVHYYPDMGIKHALPPIEMKGALVFHAQYLFNNKLRALVDGKSAAVLFRSASTAKSFNSLKEVTQLIASCGKVKGYDQSRESWKNLAPKFNVTHVLKDLTFGQDKIQSFVVVSFRESIASFLQSIVAKHPRACFLHTDSFRSELTQAEKSAILACRQSSVKNIGGNSAKEFGNGKTSSACLIM